VGSVGQAIYVRKKDKKFEPKRDYLREQVIQFVARSWADAVPKKFVKKAHEWILWGDDSLLSVRIDDAKDRTTITFGFYLSAGWGVELASHWLNLALVDGKKRLAQIMDELEWVLDEKDYPKLDTRIPFFVSGNRIGCFDGEGVMWQLPDQSYEETSKLKKDVLARAQATRKSKRCACPYCEYLVTSSSSRGSSRSRR